MEILQGFTFNAFNNFHMALGWVMVGLAFIVESKITNGEERIHWRRLVLGFALVLFGLTFLWIALFDFSSMEQRTFLRLSNGLLMIAFLGYVVFCLLRIAGALWMVLQKFPHRLSRRFRS